MHFLLSVFNVGEYRRKKTSKYKSHTFFMEDNHEAMRVRQLCARDALKDVIDWIENSNGEVAVC